MKLHVSSRWRDRLLISGVVAVQALLLIVGWVLTFEYLHERVSRGVEDLIVRSNADFAESVSLAIREVSSGLEVGDAEWEGVQSIIESIELPGAGFACVLNEDGYIIAHPEYRSSPAIGEITLADHPFLKTHDGEELALFQVDAPQPVAGTMTFFGDGVHYVSTHELNDAGYRLMVHQPVGGLTAARSLVTGVLLLTSLIVGLLVIIPTGLLSWIGIKRHHNALMKWNHELEDEVDRRVRQFGKSRDALVMGLAKLADFRDNETGKHLERICQYSVLLAEELADSGTHDIDSAWIDRLRMAASMHDIGKVGVPDEVLLKPGRLTDDEYDTIKQHPTMGADTLMAIRKQFDDDPLVDMSVEVTLSHHERWDGGGYPFGIEGDAIPLSARIVSVADVYDALTVARVYKPAMPHEKAASIIEEGRGSQFDPDVVDAFLRVQDKLREISEALRDHAHA
ncbi:HD domain-containing phosphohydrolase [Algisphaera agarilytica]|uniref:HD-GYP domain-containing protein (C-di-GMP phosphodiesterase class II) n=1 Tax=Algisphaera agarilytica TaxID=1385975 RepID=A0A7X0H714_9BACT|nr:HD domain-containing phosphohydrolase [Algisphaera agarilytica]MBB6429306.1 HD-GYP domain-containing protein (c-di-GMP phosphodiesterase class II) [Algisphaera agarilytica]